jgi:cobalt-precorrin-5B (C1)-methyltransferase
MKKRELRSGYTTGACAAAAAKAAAQLLAVAYHATPLPTPPGKVSISFPDGSRADFTIHASGYRRPDKTAFAAVIKDAGDDPDVTNGAEIVAEAIITRKYLPSALVIKGGKGVGTVTKPGLAIPVGEPAINPVPRKMIADAISEAFSGTPFRSSDLAVEITISVTNGELLAKKTLNERLGIIGGLSILGTTGIVRPLSSEAWTATIASSMDVAKAMGQTEIVLSAGRTSEKAHMKKYSLPEESYVMMGDYLEFSLREAAARRFSNIYLCAQWAKMLKIAMATPQTHVRHGAIDLGKTVDFLNGIGVRVPKAAEFNTAREIFDYLIANPANLQEALIKVCNAAKSYASDIADPVNLSAVLVAYDGEVIAHSN